MNSGTRSTENLDDLLKEALADDIPPEVAAGMRARISEFRSGTPRRSPAAGAQLFKRGLWATLAVLMLVAGGLLQGLRFSTPLAERIALMKAGLSEAAPPSRETAPQDRPAPIPDDKETRS